MGSRDRGRVTTQARELAALRRSRLHHRPPRHPSVIDPTAVVEVLDDAAREFGRWRPEGVSGIVIPGHREVG
jgi:hypothetical protein